MKGVEIQFENVDNLRDTLNAHKDEKKDENEEKLTTISEIKEVSIDKYIDEREPIDLNDKTYSIIKHILDMIGEMKDIESYQLLLMLLYWIITQRNYQIKERHIDDIIDKLMTGIEEIDIKQQYIKIKIISELMSSLDIEYYQNYSRKELNAIDYSFKKGIMPKPSIYLSRIIAK